MVMARLRSLLSSVQTDMPRRGAQPSVPEGERVYAIGDVHGRLDLLETLLDWIDSDDALRGPARTTIVFLGDLVDRGPHSRQLLDHILAREWRDKTVRFVIGNHEEVFLLVLGGDLEAARFWTRIGGDQTMLSYGVDPDVVGTGSAQDLIDAFVPLVPDEHHAFLNAMIDQHRIGSYTFVHAGVRPGVALDKQKPGDLRWIRKEFLDFEGDYGTVVVHGHSISDQAEEYANRIGIDTGAYASGHLTALVLEGSARRYLST